MNVIQKANENYFDALPDEILIKIFSFLDLDDLISVSHVDSRWKDLSQVNSVWKDIIYQPKPSITDTEKISKIQDMPALKAYSAMYTENISLIIDAICEYCRDFKHLCLSGGHNLTYPILEKLLSVFPNIEKLDIPVLKQKDSLQLVELIGKLQKLTYLRFSDRYARVEQDVLKPIADGCPLLLHMILGDSSFNDKDIQYFLVKKQKQIVSFEVCCPISALTLRCISECCNLEKLNFETKRFSDVSYDEMLLLKKLKRLKTLELCNLKSEQAKAVPSLFAENNLSNVVDLKLYLTCIEENEVNQVILNCPQLTSFALTSIHVNLDIALKNIGNCKNLTSLSLSGSHVTRKCIDYVASCPKLETLDLSCCLQTKDNVMLSVVKLKQLRRIVISYSSFLGKHFDLIPTHLIHLKEIIAYETAIKVSIWNRLLDKVPNLKIIGRDPEEL
ncbi:hypothetical protein L9F63_019807 [Diploptera punctata]|uniref:F-box domain-containing protein n=1 Tax=Diploptera punctata TaxID=6984 RepID=A0AAD7ZTK8_DIPPU|nr:hypothetical protein L9F63_019807 [Diploptera punctata]